VKRRLAPALLGLAALAAAGPSSADPTFVVGDDALAASARDATTELDVIGAAQLLEGKNLSSTELALARGYLDLYLGACDDAAAILARSDVVSTDIGAALADIAAGCERGTAATVVVKDEAEGVHVRLKDDEDRALVPYIVTVASRARARLAEDLGVDLPRPLRIDLVRDQFTLAALTGLPEEAARTTGTVAVAKWGRVIMLSPRAAQHGYPWMDTLAHELTHLALSRGTRDKAPLWFQEGVAKREETRWREPEPFDGVPDDDAVAALGFAKNIGPPIDAIGKSIALLSSPEEAGITYAKVGSFVEYFADQAGDQALPNLIARMKDLEGDDAVDRAMKDVSGASFAEWSERWRAHIESTPAAPESDLFGGTDHESMKAVSKRLRLGQLLADRGHHEAAAIELGKGHALEPTEVSLRCGLAAARLAMGDRETSAPLVEKASDLRTPSGRWWSLHAFLHPDAAGGPALGYQRAIGHDPLSPPVACQERPDAELPSDPLAAALCEAARRVPR
jgi:hypothetical protein